MRVLLVLSVLLAAGATVALSWAGAGLFSASVIRAYDPRPQPVVRAEGEPRVGERRTESKGRAVRVALTEWAAMTPDASTLVPGVSEASRPSSFPVGAQVHVPGVNWHRRRELEVRSGWPLPSMRTRRVIDELPPTPLVPLLPPFDPPGRFERGWSVPGAMPHDARFGGALPLVPIWPAFIANTLLLALGAWAIVLGPGFVMRSVVGVRRLRRGLCPGCKYPISAGGVCPECGGDVPPPVTRTGNAAWPTRAGVLRAWLIATALGVLRWSVIGVGLSVLVAWASAIASPTVQRGVFHPSELGEPLPPDFMGGARSTDHRGPGLSVRITEMAASSPGVHIHWAPDYGPPAYWPLGYTHDPQYGPYQEVTVMDVRAGLPLRCLRARRVVHSPASVAYFTSPPSPGIIEAGVTLGARERFDARVAFALPVLPVWPNLMINGAFWGVVAWVLLGLGLRARRERRAIRR